MDIETFCHCELILCVFGDFDLCLLHNHNLCIKMCPFINSDGIPLFSIHGSAANHPQTRHLPANFHLMQKKLFDTYTSAASYCQLELQTKNIRTHFTIMEKAPTRVFSWLKAPTSAFTFKTLLTHYAKQALTPRSLNVKLGP